MLQPVQVLLLLPSVDSSSQLNTVAAFERLKKDTETMQLKAATQALKEGLLANFLVCMDETDKGARSESPLREQSSTPDSTVAAAGPAVSTANALFAEPASAVSSTSAADFLKESFVGTGVSGPLSCLCRAQKATGPGDNMFLFEADWKPC